MAGLLGALRERVGGGRARSRYVEVARGCVAADGVSADEAREVAACGSGGAADGFGVGARGFDAAAPAHDAAAASDAAAARDAAPACAAARTDDGSAACGDDRSGTGCGGAAAGRAELAAFRSLYTSRDGWYALYEDHLGHLTSVNTARFV